MRTTTYPIAKVPLMAAGTVAAAKDAPGVPASKMRTPVEVMFTPSLMNWLAVMLRLTAEPVLGVAVPDPEADIVTVPLANVGKRLEIGGILLLSPLLGLVTVMLPMLRTKLGVVVACRARGGVTSLLSAVMMVSPALPAAAVMRGAEGRYISCLTSVWEAI